jgi:hypothetical protein
MQEKASQFKPKGAVAFLVAMVCTYVGVWFFVYFLMLQYRA